ncbi:related to small s protein [Fusarium torulosum]|uniref:Related to small s protein n=1 Tax=Fusarium torulosum TaxID=33205 RepID=A0AAE8MAQ7_9HYPO|nr:related to small s protein [Fusarium torulosum]
MDPITAFQVAGTVVAFVEFSYNLISETHSIYRSPDGNPTTVNRLSTIIDDLSDINDRVKHVLDVSTSRATTASDETLVRLCRESRDIATEIRTALTSLQAKGTSKLDHAKTSVIVALKSMWSRDKLANLEQRLQQIRSEMTMAMLVALWEKERLQGTRGDQGINAQINQISKAIDRNNAKLDDFLRELDATASKDNSLGPARRQRLFSKLWATDWQPPDAHLQDGFQASASDGQLDENIQSQIIRSLHFPGIEAREKLIPKPYQDTYRWIYRKDINNSQVSSPVRRQSLPQWLEDPSNKVYWITGKPGSGKSTLMNFVIHNPLTERYLQTWARPLPLLRSYFYFWEAGQNNLQRSQEGLMQTLLWQCLQQRPELVAQVTPRRWMVHHVLRGLETPAPAWTWEELQVAFSVLASENGRSFRLVLFLDGLDEFEGEPKVLIKFVRDLVATYGVKICVASRPWTDFADAFDQYPMLTMQSLTQKDISLFIKGNFEACKAFRERRALFPDQATNLLREISNKAQGVFLWVFLVVRDLIHSLSRGRSLNELQVIVDDLPTDLHNLYSKMRERVEPEDIENSARYYQLMVAALKPLHAVTLWMADGENLPEGDTFTDEMGDNMNKILQRRLDSSTKGLLELDDNGIVSFLHRTARDWVLQTAESAGLQAQAPLGFNPNLVLLQVLTKQLAHEKIYQCLGQSQLAFWSFVFLGFFYAAQIVDSPSMSPHLVQAIENFDAALCERATNLGNKSYVFSSKSVTSQEAALQRPSRWSSLRGRRKGATSASANHWSCTQYDAFGSSDTGSGIVSIAAQFTVVPYVIEMVKHDKSLLKPDPCRNPLLESAVFGWHQYKYRTYEDLAEYDLVAKRLQERLMGQRIETVKALLDLGAQPNEAGCGVLTRVEQLDDDSKLKIGPPEYWEQVSILLRAGRRRSRFGFR